MPIDFNEYRANTAALLLQGMIETETTWVKRLFDEADYKAMAHHAVMLTDHLIEQLNKKYVIEQKKKK